METNSLTKYPEGSIRELWKISFPLMISAFAVLCMIFVDRCFLARYSIAALNASVNSGTLAWAFLGGVGTLTAMSEIFVAQYTGAKFLNKIGVPVWQMVWLSLFSLVFFIPLGLWGGPLFFNGSPYAQMQIDYFGYLMFFGPSYVMMTALAGFYVGRGKTKFLIYLAIAANIINVLFDWLLIFGVPGLIPEMGIKGSAIATSIGNIFEVTILALMFLKEKNRITYGTDKWQFEPETLKKCFCIGFPNALFYALEIMGWAIFYYMMTEISEQHITISSICQSIILLLYFFFDGLNRGVVAIAGNFIGSKKLFLIPKLLKSGFKLQFVFCCFIATFLLLMPELIVNNILPKHLDDFATKSNTSLTSMLRICLICVFLYLLFEGVRWIFAGIFAAAGDTVFLMITGAFSIWIFLLGPIYFIVVKNSLAVEVAWILAATYSLILSIIYYWRYKNGKWKNLNILPQNIDVTTP